MHWCAPWRAWVVTRHEDVMEVLRRVDDFSSAGYELELLGEGGVLGAGRHPALRRHYSTPILSTTDPPVHTRLRRLLVKQFTPGVVESLRRRVEALIGELLDQVHPGTTVDLLDRFAYPLPALVIAELLGVPAVDQPRFATWSADIVAFVGTGRIESGRAARAERSMAEFQAYLEPLIARRRTDPGPDLISLLVVPAPDALELDELIGACVTLLFAGHETTAQPHRQRAPRAARAPAGARAAPRRAGDSRVRPSRSSSASTAPSSGNRRRTTRDTELGAAPDPGRRPRPRVHRLGEPRRDRLRPPRRARSRAGPGQAPRVRLRHPLLHRRRAVAAGGAARPGRDPASASRRSAWRRTSGRCGSRTSRSGGSPSSSCRSDAAAGGRPAAGGDPHPSGSREAATRRAWKTSRRRAVPRGSHGCARHHGNRTSWPMTASRREAAKSFRYERSTRHASRLSRTPYRHWAPVLVR